MTLQRRLDPAGNLSDSEWLSKDVLIRKLFAEDLDVGVSAREKDRELRVLGAETARELDPIHSRHQYVRDHQIKAFARDACEGLLARRDC